MTAVTVRQPPNAVVETAPESEAQHFHFLLLPEFSVMGFVSAIEPLRVANRSQALACAASGVRAKARPLHATSHRYG